MTAQDKDQIIKKLKAKQPKGAKNRVIWSEDESKQLEDLLSTARAEGISVSTMLNNYKAIVAPLFPEKSKGAFEHRAREVEKQRRLAEAAAAAKIQA